MLPLTYRVSWQLASVFLLVSVLLFAMAPQLWSARGDVFGHWRHSDLVLHGLTFAVLAVWFSGQYAPRNYWIIVAGLLLFGGAIEAIQSYIPYRTAESADLLADIAGIVCGMVIALLGMGGWSLRIEQWIKNWFG